MEPLFCDNVVIPNKGFVLKLLIVNKCSMVCALTG